MPFESPKLSEPPSSSSSSSSSAISSPGRLSHQSIKQSLPSADLDHSQRSAREGSNRRESISRSPKCRSPSPPKIEAPESKISPTPTNKKGQQKALVGVSLVLLYMKLKSSLPSRLCWLWRCVPQTTSTKEPEFPHCGCNSQEEQPERQKQFHKLTGQKRNAALLASFAGSLRTWTSTVPT